MQMFFPVNTAQLTKNISQLFIYIPCAWSYVDDNDWAEDVQ